MKGLALVQASVRDEAAQLVSIWQTVYLFYLRQRCLKQLGANESWKPTLDTRHMSYKQSQTQTLSLSLYRSDVR